MSTPTFPKKPAPDQRDARRLRAARTSRCRATSPRSSGGSASR